MNAQATETKVKRETKNKIRVDFERTPLLQRLKAKYLTGFFLQRVVWAIFRYVLLIGIAYIILLPFFTKIMSSFMSPEDFVDATVKLIPKYPTLDTYKYIFLENNYLEALWHTVLLSLVCALLQTFMCAVIAYGFAKFKFKGNGLLFAMVIFTMVVPHQTVRLSMYMQFRYFDLYGLIGLITNGGSIDFTNSFWPLAILSLTGLAFKNGLYIFMLRQFYRGVPDELEESAYVDGSGVLRTFIQIILPLSVPMMITVFLFAFSWQWTDSFYTNMFFTKTDYYLMPDIVAIPDSLRTSYAATDTYNAAIRNTCGLMIIAPLVIIYLFCQRYLIQGIERSGIVG